MPNIDILTKYKNIHMIGIGGVSMSGIAEILNYFGVTVTGSDLADSEIVKKLRKNGIPVTIGHDFENLSKADIVVYSAAINSADPEMQKAKELNIPTCERCDFLGMLTKAIDGNYKVGSSEHFIIEACEYVESFLKFFPKAEIILNIDNDHLDYFKTFENIKNAFIKYVKIIPDDGLLVVNGDDHNCLDLLQYTNATKLTYGITNKNTDFFAVNIVFDNNGFPAFDVYKKDKFFERIQLRIPGMHNVLNALATIALCDYYGIQSNYIKTALQKFTGAHRRFEYKGTIKNATVFDDYGHHPTEIIATAKALMNKKYNKSWVVFQPHTYSRTKTLLNDFAKALLNFDNIIVTDIYAARETNRYGVSSQDLVDKINSLGKEAIYIQNFDDIINYLKENVKENDIILTLGAGTVTQISNELVEEN